MFMQHLAMTGPIKVVYIDPPLLFWHLGGGGWGVGGKGIEGGGEKEERGKKGGGGVGRGGMREGERG